MISSALALLEHKAMTIQYVAILSPINTVTNYRMLVLFGYLFILGMATLMFSY